MKRLQGHEFGIRGRSQMSLIIKIREIEALFGKCGKARRDELALYLKPNRECLQGLGANQYNISAARDRGQLRRALPLVLFIQELAYTL
jgi:hypothetical protein